MFLRRLISSMLNAKFENAVKWGTIQWTNQGQIWHRLQEYVMGSSLRCSITLTQISILGFRWRWIMGIRRQQVYVCDASGNTIKLCNSNVFTPLCGQMFAVVHWCSSFYLRYFISRIFCFQLIYLFDFLDKTDGKMCFVVVMDNLEMHVLPIGLLQCNVLLSTICICFDLLVHTQLRTVGTSMRSEKYATKRSIYGGIAEIPPSYKKSGSWNTKVTSDFKQEVEIWPFRACAVKNTL